MTDSYRKLGLEFCHQIIKAPESSVFQVYDHYEIFFLLSGTGDFGIEHHKFHLKPGDLIIINNSEAHQGFSPQAGNSEAFRVQFDPELLAPFSQTFNLYHCFRDRAKGEANKLILTKPQREKTQKLFGRIANLFSNPFYADEVIKYTALIELVFYINRLYLNFSHIDERPNLPENLALVLEYINDNLQNELTLESLEKTFYINKSHLGRLFQKYLNVSIHEYIILQRISKAKELLLDGYSALEAGRFAGFYDYSNFRKMFKKVTTVSPSEYVKKQRDEQINPGVLKPYRRRYASGLPDLVVTDLSWCPAKPQAGEGVNFKATVQNIGKGAVPVGVILGVGFQVNGLTATWSDNYTLGLSAGEVIELSANNGQGGVPVWQAQAGTYQITAHVDDIGRIDETDRANNQLVKTLKIE